MTLNEISTRTNLLNEGWAAFEADKSILLNPYEKGTIEGKYWAEGHKMAGNWETSMQEGDE